MGAKRNAYTEAEVATVLRMQTELVGAAGYSMIAAARVISQEIGRSVGSIQQQFYKLGLYKGGRCLVVRTPDRRAQAKRRGGERRMPGDSYVSTIPRPPLARIMAGK